MTDKSRFWREFRAAKVRHEANPSKPVVPGRIITRAEHIAARKAT